MVKPQPFASCQLDPSRVSSEALAQDDVLTDFQSSLVILFFLSASIPFVILRGVFLSCAKKIAVEGPH